jgi:hypothetical protein
MTEDPTPPDANPRDTEPRDPDGVQDSDPPGGPFRSWGGLYLTLILYGVGTIVLLYVLTRVLNVGVGS